MTSLFHKTRHSLFYEITQFYELKAITLKNSLTFSINIHYSLRAVSLTANMMVYPSLILVLVAMFTKPILGFAYQYGTMKYKCILNVLAFCLLNIINIHVCKLA